MFADNSIDASAIKTLAGFGKASHYSKGRPSVRMKIFSCVSKEKSLSTQFNIRHIRQPGDDRSTENDLTGLHIMNTVLCLRNGSFWYLPTMFTPTASLWPVWHIIRLAQIRAGIICQALGVPSLQWEQSWMKPTAIVAVPSFIMKLIHFAKEHGIDINSSREEIYVLARTSATQIFHWSIIGKNYRGLEYPVVFNSMASTEMQTALRNAVIPVAATCSRNWSSLKCFDENNNPVKLPVNRAKWPLLHWRWGHAIALRYKTGDICIYHDELCGCGRTTTRLSPVVGRRKQMIKFKGTTLYPPALFDMLNELEDVKDYVAEVYSNEMGTDEVLIYIVPSSLTRRAWSYHQANLGRRDCVLVRT